MNGIPLIASAALLLASSHTDLPIDIHIEVAPGETTESPSDALVTVTNHAEQAASNLQLTLYVERIRKQQLSAGQLDPNQSIAERFELPGSIHNAILEARYEFSHKASSVVRAIDIPERPKDNSTLVLILPVVSGLVTTLLGAAIGAYLVHSFTRVREEARVRFEWRKMLFEKYEKPYREFLSQWADSSSATILESQFRLLQDTSFVPGTVTQAYRQALQVLSDTSSTKEQIEYNRAALRQAVEEAMMDPGP